MPTVLDNVLETHEGPEPKVLTTDVQAVLKRVVTPEGEDSDGEAVARIADRAKVSPRTVYRVLNPERNEDGSLKRPALTLDLADRLCLAVGVHLAYSCKLVWPDGSITDYVTGRYLEPMEEE